MALHNVNSSDLPGYLLGPRTTISGIGARLGMFYVRKDEGLLALVRLMTDCAHQHPTHSAFHGLCILGLLIDTSYRLTREVKKRL